MHEGIAQRGRRHAFIRVLGRLVIRDGGLGDFTDGDVAAGGQDLHGRGFAAKVDAGRAGDAIVFGRGVKQDATGNAALDRDGGIGLPHIVFIEGGEEFRVVGIGRKTVGRAGHGAAEIEIAAHIALDADAVAVFTAVGNACAQGQVAGEVSLQIQHGRPVADHGEGASKAHIAINPGENTDGRGIIAEDRDRSVGFHDHVADKIAGPVDQDADPVAADRRRAVRIREIGIGIVVIILGAAFRFHEDVAVNGQIAGIATHDVDADTAIIIGDDLDLAIHLDRIVAVQRDGRARRRQDDAAGIRDDDIVRSTAFTGCRGRNGRRDLVGDFPVCEGGRGRDGQRDKGAGKHETATHTNS